MSPSGDDDLQAAELAFGLLDAAERDAAEARLAADPTFASAYRRWLDHAAGLLDGRDEQPRSSVWNAIAERLPANDEGRAATVSRTSLRVWQAATALATAAAIVLAVVATQHPPAPAPSLAATPLVAILDGEGSLVVSVSFDRVSRRLIVAPSGLAIGRHAAQLWVIPADGAPRSLGLIEPTAPGTPSTPTASALIAPGATLAISVEPIGGSPTGKPTGPVIAKGKVVKT